MFHFLHMLWDGTGVLLGSAALITFWAAVIFVTLDALR